MDPEIAGAIISAISSIVIAWIGFMQQSAGKRKASRASPTARVLQPQPIGRLWFGVAAFLSFGALAATLFIHHDLGANIIFLSPVVFFVLAFVRPIQPLIAAAISLIPFPFAFVSEPLYRMIHQTQTPFSGFTSRHLVIWLSFAAVGGVCTAAVCWWRRRGGAGMVEAPARSASSAANVHGGSAGEIEKLWQLHREGALSEAEYRRAKKKILSEDN